MGNPPRSERTEAKLMSINKIQLLWSVSLAFTSILSELIVVVVVVVESFSLNLSDKVVLSLEGEKL